jgi:hypothetical protein
MKCTGWDFVATVESPPGNFVTTMERASRYFITTMECSGWDFVPAMECTGGNLISTVKGTGRYFVTMGLPIIHLFHIRLLFFLVTSEFIVFRTNPRLIGPV